MAKSNDMVNTAIFAAVIVGGLYFVGRKLAGDTVATIEEKRQIIGAAIGETIFGWFHPDSDSPLDTYFVTFPDGTNRSVNAETIDDDGYFTYWRDGSKWRVAVAESGRRVAVPA